MNLVIGFASPNAACRTERGRNSVASTKQFPFRGYDWSKGDVMDFGSIDSGEILGLILIMIFLGSLVCHSAAHTISKERRFH